MNINQYISKRLPVFYSNGGLWYRFGVAYDGIVPFFTKPELASFISSLKKSPCFNCVSQFKKKLTEESLAI